MSESPGAAELGGSAASVTAALRALVALAQVQVSESEPGVQAAVPTEGALPAAELQVESAREPEPPAGPEQVQALVPVPVRAAVEVRVPAGEPERARGPEPVAAQAVAQAPVLERERVPVEPAVAVPTEVLGPPLLSDLGREVVGRVRLAPIPLNRKTARSLP